MTTPKFLIPSFVWSGLGAEQETVAPAAGTPVLAAGGWGGDIGADTDVRKLLQALKPALVLLNLAGYQAPEVAIGIPTTVAGQVVAVDLRTMTYARGTPRPWPAQATGWAQVALWVEPRFPVAPPAVATGPTLSLVTVAGELDPAIALDFAGGGTGWLRLTWDAGVDWDGAITQLMTGLTGSLADALAEQFAAAAAHNGAVAPLCGLLGLYEAATWRMPRPWPPDKPTSDGVTELGEALDVIIGTTGRATFLAEEVAHKPPSVRERWFFAPADEPSDAGDELVEQTREVALSDRQRLALSDSARPGFPDLPVTQLLVYAQELGVLDFLTTIGEQVAAAYAGDLYGGKALRRGDSDSPAVYEGQAYAPAPAVGYVAQLRRDLAALGFGPMFKYDPAETGPKAFDYDLEFAVRELQSYARLANLAQETADAPGTFYADTLTQVPNPAPYGGPVSGVVNAATRALILTWLGANLRCPVVVEARTRSGAKYVLKEGTKDAAWRATDNVWRREQVEEPGAQMHARDFTGHWPALDGVAPMKDGTFGQWLDWKLHGPAALPEHCRPEDELTPEALIGTKLEGMSPGERSTFRVIRACAEVEDWAYFPAFNAYDLGVLSIGPFQWTLGYQKPDAEDKLYPSELPAYLAYLEGREPETFQSTYATFGCGVTSHWADGTSSGNPPSDCWIPGEVKYLSWISLQNEAGGFDPAPTADSVIGTWFRGWHWFFRLSMAARTSLPFRRRIWDYARFRVRDLLAKRHTLGARAVTLGDLFTSELAVALLVRWHVNSPGSLLVGPPKGKSGLERVLDEAETWGDPADWRDDRQITLCDRLLSEGSAVNDSLADTMAKITDWGDPDIDSDAPKDHHPKSWWIDSWRLPYADVFDVPRITQANEGKPVGKATIPLAIDWRDPIDGRYDLTFMSSKPAVVAPGDIVPDAGKPPATVTITSKATGTTTITIAADNGAHVGRGAFKFSAGGPAEKDAPAQPASEVGMSRRRHSFQRGFGGLP